MLSLDPLADSLIGGCHIDLNQLLNVLLNILVPYGVFIGCQDLDVCKRFATSACMLSWVRDTCKSKCGQCDYGKERVARPGFEGT